MTLPAFTAERRRLQHGARSERSTSAASAGAQLQTHRPPLLLSIDGTDGLTDARSLHRPCTAYYANNVKNNNTLIRVVVNSRTVIGKQ